MPFGGAVHSFRDVFAIFSSRLGCLGSVALSVALTVALYLLMRH